MRKTLFARIGSTHVEAHKKPYLRTPFVSVRDDLPDAFGDPSRNGTASYGTTVVAERAQNLQFDHGETRNGKVVVWIGTFYLKVKPPGPSVVSLTK